MFKLIIISYFFYQYSPSLSVRSKALINNPAGLAFQQGFEIFYNLKKIDYFDRKRENFNHTLTASLSNFGFFIHSEEKKKIYKIGSGIPFGERVSAGISYTFGDTQKFYTLGLMLRPLSFFSIGLKNDLYKSYREAILGFAFRPITDRITLSADLKFKKDTLDSYSFLFSLEPVEGILFNLNIETCKGFYKDNTRYLFGIEFSLGNGILSYSMDKDEREKNFSIITSKEIYPKLYKRKNRWIEIRLKDSYPEERERGDFLSFKIKECFYDLVSDFERILKDDEIEGVIIYFENPQFSRAQAEELRKIIKKISDKKFTVAYGENFSENNYYIASSCDKIIIPKEGSLILAGPYTERFYFKKLFDKTGIKAQFERVAEYKSAVEPFTRENMSKEDSIQISLFLKRILDKEIEDISSSRNITKDTLLKIMEKEVYFNSYEALKEKLVDTVAYENEIIDITKKWFSKKKIKKISYKKWDDEKFLKREFVDSKPKIAILSLEGSIVEGESGRNPLPLIGGKMIGSKTVQEIVAKIERDKSIKAVVIRVNSPGGSSLASDIIWNSIRKLKEKKKVVVSMGQYAASGGYYISSPADYIIANYSTLTGSIGILGGKISFDKMFEKIGITFDRVKILKYSDAFSIFREWNEEEIEELKEELNWGYDNFIKKVAYSRNLKETYVDSIGRGRIWSGFDAKNLKIIDDIGGILEAIEIAKKLSGIKKDFNVVIYPKIDLFKEFFKKSITFKSPLGFLQEEPYIYYNNIILK
ncbi:MAG: signal peptide peptidase SppA [Candidatus Hydrothermales bacterium]